MKRLVLVLIMVLAFGICFAQGIPPQKQMAVNLDQAEEKTVVNKDGTVSVNAVMYDKAGKEVIVATQKLDQKELTQQIDRTEKVITKLTEQKAKLEGLLAKAKAATTTGEGNE